MTCPNCENQATVYSYNENDAFDYEYSCEHCGCEGNHEGFRVAP